MISIHNLLLPLPTSQLDKNKQKSREEAIEADRPTATTQPLWVQSPSERVAAHVDETKSELCDPNDPQMTKRCKHRADSWTFQSRVPHLHRSSLATLVS